MADKTPELPKRTVAEINQDYLDQLDMSITALDSRLLKVELALKEISNALFLPVDNATGRKKLTTFGRMTKKSIRFNT